MKSETKAKVMTVLKGVKDVVVHAGVAGAIAGGALTFLAGVAFLQGAVICGALVALSDIMTLVYDRYLKGRIEGASERLGAKAQGAKVYFSEKFSKKEETAPVAKAVEA